MPMILNLLVLALAAASPAQRAQPHYTLVARVDPAAHRIAVQGQLTGWSCATGQLYLHRGFRLERLRVGGREVAAVLDTAGAPPMWVPVARPIKFSCPGATESDTVQFEYTGEIADTISGVNLITPSLVELALYSGWFPRDPARSFTYDLQLDLPRGWVVAGTAGAVRSRPRGDRQTVRITSTAPAGDIPFVAAPDLVTERVAGAGSAAEVLAAARDRDLARAQKNGLARTLALYRQWFGPTGQAAAGQAALRFVYSPRSGWGYSRLPLVIVSAGHARSLSREPLGAAWNLQGNAHEVAHFWWGIADPNTLDDWLNEGLAEFSAADAVAAQFGAEARDSLLARYRADAGHARSDVPIARTPTESPDRYVNRYEKAALVLVAVESRVGADRFRAFLAGFHTRYGARRDARTEDFLREAKAALGAEVGGMLERCVLGPWAGCPLEP